MSYPQREYQGNGQQRGYYASGRRTSFTSPPPPTVTRLHRDNDNSSGMSGGSPSPRMSYGTSPSRSMTPSRTTSSHRDTGTSNTQPNSPSRGNVQANYGVTRFQRDNLQSPSAATRAPPGQKSVFQSQNDTIMAARQTQYDQLDDTQREEQDDWVASIAARTDACVNGHAWVRHPTAKGYVCTSGNRFMTDELIAEGKGGCYCSTYLRVVTRDLIGPWYENDDGIWVYRGDGIPARNFNRPEKRDMYGERCGVPALGWIDGSQYEQRWMRYAPLHW